MDKGKGRVVTVGDEDEETEEDRALQELLEVELDEEGEESVVDPTRIMLGNWAVLFVIFSFCSLRVS